MAVRERIFAACAPGLEPVLAAELADLGLSVSPLAGGVEAEGEDAVALACLGSRVADAVRLRLHQGSPAELSSARAEALRRFGPTAQLHVRRAGRQATLSLEVGGAPLHKRGWRARVGAAPLRETLAAGILLACRYDGAAPFLDPMCGSGTLAIEAALLAGRRAPGLGRTFAFEQLPGHDARRTAAVRARLAAEARPIAVPIHASDRNMGALRLAQKNAAAAGLASAIRFERCDAAEVAPPPGAGLCAVNPPYGIRLDEDPVGSWRALASLLGRLAGWEVAVLGPARGMEGLLPTEPIATLPLQNGGVRCLLSRFRP